MNENDDTDGNIQIADPNNQTTYIKDATGETALKVDPDGTVQLGPGDLNLMRVDNRTHHIVCKNLTFRVDAKHRREIDPDGLTLEVPDDDTRL